MEVLQQWREQEMKGTFFIDSLKIKSEGEFLISSGTLLTSWAMENKEVLSANNLHLLLR